MVRLVLAWQFNNTLKVKLSYQHWSDSLSGDESSYIVCEILVTKSYTIYINFIFWVFERSHENSILEHYSNILTLCTLIK